MKLDKQSIGETTGFKIDHGSVINFSFTNKYDKNVFLYPIEIDNLGRIIITPIWVDEDIRLFGFKSKKTVFSHNFNMTGDPGLYEIIFLSSPRKILFLDSPPYFGAKGSQFSYSRLETGDIINEITLKRIRYVILKSLTNS